MSALQLAVESGRVLLKYLFGVSKWLKDFVKWFCQAFVLCLGADTPAAAGTVPAAATPAASTPAVVPPVTTAGAAPAPAAGTPTAPAAPSGSTSSVTPVAAAAPQPAAADNTSLSDKLHAKIKEQIQPPDISFASTLSTDITKKINEAVTTMEQNAFDRFTKRMQDALDQLKTSNNLAIAPAMNTELWMAKRDITIAGDRIRLMSLAYDQEVIWPCISRDTKIFSDLTLVLENAVSNNLIKHFTESLTRADTKDKATFDRISRIVK